MTQAKHCEPCRGGAPPIDPETARARLGEVPGWELAGDGKRLRRTFDFDDFASALDFARTVGEAAEAEGHHPEISLGWGYCTVEFYTHKIGGLHENDFIMAAKVSALAPGGE